MKPDLPMSGRYAFIDLETTGGNPVRDHITEVGIVLVDDGAIVDQWASLVRPGVPIPPEIQRLTGITNAMVADAPPFDAIADTIVARLKKRTLVAHNARFDYGFLRAEFRRCGRSFRSPLLCTVRLSRRLFPEHARHGLDALIERHALTDEQRHRALGDARLIARFFLEVVGREDPETVSGALRELVRRPAVPPWLSEKVIDDLPETPGVYIFRGRQGQALYVGKALNLRERVQAHFHADSRDSNDARLTGETHAIQTIDCAGEFSALSCEIQHIRSEAPLYNRALRRQSSACFVQWPDAPADLVPRFVPVSSVDPAQFDAGREASGVIWSYGPFGSRPAARAALVAIGREHGLCDRALGLWTGDRPCFSHQLGRCAGYCRGFESAASQRARIHEAMAPLRMPVWPFDGPIAIEEADGRPSPRFDRWCLVDPARTGHPDFDIAVFKLLRRTLARATTRVVVMDREPGPSAPERQT